MPSDETKTLLETSRRIALDTLRALPGRPVHATASVAQLRGALSTELTVDGENAQEVLETFAAAAEPGIIGSTGPRYFGFVIGGTYPLAIAVDWLATVWDQNAGIYATSPASAVIEETVSRWVLDLLKLPADASVGFVTGGQMANFTCLAAARHAVLRKAGWNVEEKGLEGAPHMNVVLPEEAHITIYASLRYLGLGSSTSLLVACDQQGRMIPAELERVLATCEGPTVVCAQAGNVNSGAFDAIDRVVALAHARDAWVHVDAAFGLWASASERFVHLLHGVEGADSWATDAHKWMNVPYDCGIAIVADSAAHRASMTVSASYLEQTLGAERDSFDWVPEFSRRARSLPLYAVLRQLGRRGVAELIERCCDHAARFASILSGSGGVSILNEPVLNQLLVRFDSPGFDADELTRAVIKRVQQDGICWLGGTTWKGRAAMRISVSNWSTTDEDVRISSEAILSAYQTVVHGG